MPTMRFLESTISDDPFLRRMQLVEAVLHNCADLLWHRKQEKLRRVPQWLDRVRSVIKRHAQHPPSPPQHPQQPPSPHAPQMPSKNNSSRLVVASVDAVKFKGESQPASVEEDDDVETDPVEGCCAGSTTSVVSSSSHLEEMPLQVRHISGGITNELFHVFDPENNADSVVVRVYGKETDRVISRESELFYQSKIIDTYVHGGNFLIYKYLCGFLPLPYEELASECPNIMEKLANFQVMCTRAAKGDVAQPLIHDSSACQAGVESRFYVDGQLQDTVGNRYSREKNLLFHALSQWPLIVASEEIVAKVNPEKRERFCQTGSELQSECDKMLRYVEQQMAETSDVASAFIEGTCHNDLLAANIMRNDATNEFVIIDFDYTRRNFLLYDLANHINEYCGLDCDYAEYFPSDEHITKMVRDYRAHVRRELERLAGSAGSDASGDHYDGPVFDHQEIFWQPDEAAEAAVVATWAKVVKQLTLSSHLLWGVWSLLQEAVSSIDVDFLDYAIQRFNRYKETLSFLE